MGLLLDYLQKFATETMKANGIVSRKTISEWFGNKQSIQRNGYEDVLSFNTKAAVVVVGVSGVGKSSYVKNFLKMFPDVKLISYDDANYQKEEEKEKGKKVSDGRMMEIVEERILACKDESIIVDSNCILPYARAALIRFLSDLGYEIHMVYFSQKYTEAHISSCCMQRAIELTLFKDYLVRHKMTRKPFRDRMNVRDDIVKTVAKERGITEDDLRASLAKDPTKLATFCHLVNEYKREVEESRMWWQEKRGLFFLGADYCYVL